MRNRRKKDFTEEEAYANGTRRKKRVKFAIAIAIAIAIAAF
jgi:hypothetical protein